MKVTDPVCGMSVESSQAAATEKFREQSFYFCSTQCRDKFKANPAQYAGKAASAHGAAASHGGHCH